MGQHEVLSSNQKLRHAAEAQAATSGGRVGSVAWAGETADARTRRTFALFCYIKELGWVWITAVLRGAIGRAQQVGHVKTEEGRGRGQQSAGHPQGVAGCKSGR